MRYILSLIMAGATSLACLATPPKLIAPKTAEVGDVISVKLDTQPVAVDWHVTSSGKDVNTIALPDGSLIFGSGAGPRKVKVAAAVAYTEKDVTKAVLLETVVTVGEAQPEPEPQPDNPTPSLPDGKYGLAKFVNGLAGGLDAKGKAALADSFKALQSQIAAGRFARVEDALTATAQANRDALSKAGVPTSGFDGFFTKLQDKLYSLYTGNQLVKTADVATAWGEIATGLGAK